MVHIDIPILEQKDTFIGDGTEDTFLLTKQNAFDIHVAISGLYMTENQDYIISGNYIIFTEIPLLNENINVFYKY
jgi:hypothetical protein